MPMSVLCLTPPCPPCLSSVALRSCPPTGLPPLPISFRCSNTSVLFQHAALVLEYCYFNPLYASSSLSSVAAPFSLLPCALAYGKFALCQAALNSVTGTTLSTAAAHLPAASHTAVVNTTGGASAACCTSSGSATTAQLLQLSYNTLTGLGGQRPFHAAAPPALILPSH